MQRSPPADRHGAPDKESFRRPWVIRADPSTLTTESKVLNLSEVKRRMPSDAEQHDGALPQLADLTRHDQVCSRLCGIEHGPVPRAQLVAPLPNDTR